MSVYQNRTAQPLQPMIGPRRNPGRRIATLVGVIRLLAVVVVTVAAGGCFQDPHAQDGVEVHVQTDCYMCHKGEYEQAGRQTLDTMGCLSTVPPIHVGNKPTTCGDCHNIDAWCPALDGIHPETAFPISRGHHQGIACLDCHSLPGPSTGGMNVSCVTSNCHPRSWYESEHEEGPAWNSSNPTFCRNSGCHPDGRVHGD